MNITWNVLAMRMWRLLKSEEGQDLMEYGLLAALLALGAMAAVKSLASDINNQYVYIQKMVSTMK